MLMDWLNRWAMYSPSAVAFQDADTNEQLTYREIFFLSCALATHLRETYGVTRGDRVAILSLNELEYVALFFACQRLGAMIVPLNFRLAAPELDSILSDSEPKLLILQDAFFSAFKLLKSAPAQVWFLDGAKSVRDFCRVQLDLLRSGAVIVEQTFAGEFDDACMILYTSGTTGEPKGALITNKMLHWNSLNTGLRLNLQQCDVALGFLPFSHTSGWNVLVTPFVHRGARTVLMRKFDAERVLEISEREGVTVISVFQR